jgi:cyclase
MADELIIVNLDLDSISIETFAELVSEVSSEIFMPLSVGGGIDSLEKASKFFEIGIEKIVVERGLISKRK